MIAEQSFTDARNASKSLEEQDAVDLVYADWLEERGDAGRAYGLRLAVALRQVIARPEEDEPRLSYADLCAAFGQPERAEFIRVQLQLAQLGCRITDTNQPGFGRRRSHTVECGEVLREFKCLPLRKRENELLRHPFHFGRKGGMTAKYFWTGHLNLNHTEESVNIEYVRGFVEEFGCSWQEWVGDDGRSTTTPRACDGVKEHPLQLVTLWGVPNIDLRNVSTTEEEEPQYKTTLLRTTFQVQAGYGPGLWVQRLLRVNGNGSEYRGHAQEMVRREIARYRTPESYCRLRWPSVKAWRFL